MHAEVSTAEAANELEGPAATALFEKKFVKEHSNYHTSL
jgi:hypothetical protein